MKSYHSTTDFLVRQSYILFLLLHLAAGGSFAQAPSPKANGAKPSVAEAEKFIKEAEKRVSDLSIQASRADWVNSNFITDDTEALSAQANQELIAAVTPLAKSARKFEGLKLSTPTARKFKLLRLALTLPAPSTPAEREELTKIAVSMKSDYGKGKYCPEAEKGKCLTLNDMERIMATSRNPEELKGIWLGWHKVSPPYRPRYVRYVDLANKGAREMGHNYYQMAYAPQPPLFQSGANDGFHEAIGDAVALSVTPEYLKQIGLIDRVPDPSADIGLLLQLALDKVAFLPFGYLVDQWRWKVFSGEIGPADYNNGWWDLRLKYQGIAPPSPRTEQDFDAGAKLIQMMEMGQSHPWPEALKALTGDDKMDASAILDYFAPLKKWLDEQTSAMGQ